VHLNYLENIILLRETSDFLDGTSQTLTSPSKLPETSFYKLLRLVARVETPSECPENAPKKG
jgi:hypothetical protein